MVPVINYRYRLVYTGISQIIPQIGINSYPDSVKTLEIRKVIIIKYIDQQTFNNGQINRLQQWTRQLQILRLDFNIIHDALLSTPHFSTINLTL